MNNEVFKTELGRIRNNPDRGNIATVILDSEKTESKEYIPCLVIEGEKGYHRTDWHWGTDKAIARECANERNAVMELSEETVQAIIFASMF